jgi:O-antigen ligase
MYELPLGKDIIDILLLATLVGWLIHNKTFEKIKINKVLYFYCFFTFISLLLGSKYLGTKLFSYNDLRIQLWKDYLLLPIIFFIVLNNIKDSDEIKSTIFNISIIFLIIIFKHFREFQSIPHFHFDEKARIVFVFSHLGPNYFAAFLVQSMAIFFGLHYFAKNKKLKIYYFSVALVSFYPIIYSYSRAGYLAAGAVLFLIGIFKDKKLLIACIFFIIFWQVILPNSVLERLNFKEEITNEGSNNKENHRIIMWKIAYNLFKEAPIFGVGFRVTYYIEFDNAPIVVDVTGVQHRVRSIHSLYFQTLAEMGIIGIFFILYMFLAAFISGWKLYKNAKDKFLKGLGFGFSMAVIASFITNIFGDRWYIFILQAYYWILWALVERGLIITKKAKQKCMQK